MKVEAQTLRDLLHYDPDAGHLTWKVRDRSLFATDRAHSTWNARYAGKPALTSRQSHGYLHGCVLGQDVLAHRAAFAIHHGRWPESEIDHINGDKTDNSLGNLREVSRAENMRNLPRRGNAVPGVGRSSNGKAWVARIGDGVFLGTFPSAAAAAAARREAEARLGYHPNHGRNLAQKECI